MSTKKPTTYSGAALRLARAERERAAVDPAEQARRALANCERLIETARQSFLDIGRALLEIHSGKLYEVDGFEGFDEYVSERWEMTARQAYRLITGYRINLILRPIGHSLQSEAAARELAPLANDEGALVAVYTEAVRRAGGGRVTAALVAAARDALAPPVIDGEFEDTPTKTPPAPAEPENGKEGATEDGGPVAPSTPDIGLADAANVDESSEDRPAGEPGEAEIDHSAADVTTPSANQTGTASSPEEHGPVDEPERAAGAGVLPPPAPDSDVPSWLRAVTAVCSGVHDLAAESPSTVADVIDRDLAAEIGIATSRLRAWYMQMQTAMNEADGE